MSAPLPRVGDRLRGPTGLVVRCLCRGQTFLTLYCRDEEHGPSRLYVPLREWPAWADRFRPMPRLAR